MSAFLGPIHHWLYRKIQLQNDLTIAILDAYNVDGLAGMLAEKYGTLETEPLENCIDGTNIHGWLQQRVSLVEIRLAAAVTFLCEKKHATLSDLEKIAFAFGKARQPAPLQNAKLWYTHLSNLLLDGMPCDHANEIISEQANEVVWQKNLCVHQAYWDAVGGEVQHYDRLRDSLIAGLLDGSGIGYEKAEGNVFKLIRRGSDEWNGNACTRA